MGRSSRPKPARLSEKLRRIRDCLGLSQNEMLRHLSLDEELFQGSVSGYELGTREPPLMVLLQYARSANIYVEALIDDELDLPGELPAGQKSEGIRRGAGAKSAHRRPTLRKRRTPAR
jgi:transcriptional regulator with XRE-family HTH domain